MGSTFITTGPSVFHALLSHWYSLAEQNLNCRLVVVPPSLVVETDRAYAYCRSANTRQRTHNHMLSHIHTISHKNTHTHTLSPMHTHTLSGQLLLGKVVGAQGVRHSHIPRDTEEITELQRKHLSLVWRQARGRGFSYSKHTPHVSLNT